MSNTVSLQAFLAGKSFVIPPYQRDYSWTIKEVDELFADVQDVIDTNTAHYFGTVVLAQAGAAFEVVDGQQRLSTAILLVHALLAQLDPSDRIRIADEVFLMNNGSGLKLDFGPNRLFVADLFAGREPSPKTGGQRRLQQAYQQYLERARAIQQDGGNSAIYSWLQAIKNLELIAFSEGDTGRAIRLFQSVNDRGRPLTYMDKAKALLVLYSNRFLGGALDGRISEAFGACFAAYDRVREQASQSGYEIELINRATFSEDEILRYHYLAYDALEACDFYGYSQTILEYFLKPALRKRQGNPTALQEFISDYIDDLEAFAQAFASLVDATRSDVRIFGLLVLHRLAARLYPITIRLQHRGLLSCPVPGTSPVVDLLHCLDVVDLRVYKLRGTDPARDVGMLAHGSRNANVAEIAARLHEFVAEFMPDGLMQTQLGQPMYKNGATVPLLFAFEQSVAQPYSLPQLVALTKAVPTQEHILAQEPGFDSTGYGFADEIDFNGQVDRIGNLALLTDSENKRCQNKAVQSKMSEPNLYPSSAFAGTRYLAAQFAVNRAVFDKKAVLMRTDTLTQFALSRWAIW